MIIETIKRNFKTIIFLGVVCFFIIFLCNLFFVWSGDSDGGSEDNVFSEGRTKVKESGNDYTLDRSEYGIIVKYKGYEVEENFTVEEENVEIIDCRKMSSNLRESLISEDDNECYQVKILSGGESYIVIRTGNGYYTDPVEQSIRSDNSVFKEFPISKLNFPQERITIADFPTNFIGTGVSYENGEEYVFYKGIVYKGADKYAITVRGELDEGKRNILRDLYLD